MEMQSVQKLDGQGALAGIKASRLWTPLTRPEHPKRPALDTP